MKREGAALFLPKDRSLPVLRAAVQNCHGCDLYRHATQAVIGELETGTDAKQPRVAIMMIGEQPGDREDKEGRPMSFLKICDEPVPMSVVNPQRVLTIKPAFVSRIAR